MFIFFSISLSRTSSIEYTKMAGVIAQQLLILLTPHLEKLVKEGIKKISLRVNLDSNPDNVSGCSFQNNFIFIKTK